MIKYDQVLKELWAVLNFYLKEVFNDSYSFLCKIVVVAKRFEHFNVAC